MWKKLFLIVDFKKTPQTNTQENLIFFWKCSVSLPLKQRLGVRVWEALVMGTGEEEQILSHGFAFVSTAKFSDRNKL